MVATGSPERETARSADLRPARAQIACSIKDGPAGPWLQRSP